MMTAEQEAGHDEPGRREMERELLEAMQEEMRRIPVADYIVGLLMSLSSMAFQRLGLTAETTPDRDLAQSRLAVDAFAALVDVLATERPAGEIELYRSTLHQMRLAYVTALERDDGSAPAPSPTEDAEAVGGDHDHEETDDA